MKRTVSFRSSVSRAKSANSSSLVPRIVTQLTLSEPRPAASHSSSPRSTVESSPVRVMRRKRSGRRLSRLIVTRSRPASFSGRASSFISMPLVVNERSSMPCTLRRSLTRSTNPCRTVGSPPVSLNRRIPCRSTAAFTTSEISSKLRMFSFGSHRTPSSGMQ